MSRNRVFIVLTLLMVMLSMTIVACGDEKTETTPEAQAPASVQNVTVQQAYDVVSQNNGAIFIDVREQSEWNQIHAVGATLIPLSVFDQQAPNQLPKDGEIYIICNSGNRSADASQRLINLGYENVYNIQGGTQAWVGAGLPTE